MLIASFLSMMIAADGLAPGQPAPQLSTDSVLKGTDVKTFQPGKVYVVEFWATWCKPCRDSIPHLTELQKKHPEITVIGVAGFERAPSGDMPAADKEKARVKKAADFVSQQGDKMGYTVLYDGDGSMGAAWMDAARQRGIPCSFVVDGAGKVSFIGFPDSNLDAAVEAAVKTASSKSSNSDSDSKSSSESKKSSDKKSSSNSSSSNNSSNSGNSSSSGGSKR